MDSQAFTDLLTGQLSTRVIWANSHRCPCLDQDGGVNIQCPVCGGLGQVWDEWSDTFQCGITNVTARALEQLIHRWGPGMVGAANISIPENAPIYASVGQSDRFALVDTRDIVEWSLVPGVQVRIPPTAKLVNAMALDNTKTKRVPVPVPVPDVNDRITASIAMVLTLDLPRRYEIVGDLPRSRSWTSGLPKTMTAKLIDVSTRW